MSEPTIQNDGTLVEDDEDHSAESPALDEHGAVGAQSVRREDSPAVGPDSIRSKPLIELLKIAEVMGVISGWSISGPSLVLRRGQGNILVRAVDAGGLLVRLMAEKSAEKRDCYPVNTASQKVASS